MGGGLMQLVAYGAQDIYLTGNPQITFFKVVYRRHTNFSIEAIRQVFDGSTTNLHSGGIKSVLISRNGDLVYKMWIECDLTYDADIDGGSPTYTNWVNNTGHALIEECDIEIGGQRMDKHVSEWLDIYNELTDHEESEWIGLNKHSAKNAYLKSQTETTLAATPTRLYIPLKFWFCNNVGLALPLIALQYHEVKLNIKFRSIYGLINSNGASTLTTSTNAKTSPTLFADYIYLDTDERRRFAQVSHEYLIEQLQYSKNTATTNLLLNFNHPVKEVIWVMPNKTFGLTKGDTSGDSDSIDATIIGNHKNDYFNYNASQVSGFKHRISNQDSYEGFKKATIKLNGHTRFKERDASYFRICQPQQAGHKIPTKHIYMYSFALNPEEHQPSGTCNFSRVDNAHLNFTEVNDKDNYKLNVYVINYNVLRIMSGMGGLAYSN
jgi:hypothetical protein